MIVYILGGVFASFSAIILASRMYSGQPNAGTGFELQVVAAVILGGISLTGGVGSIVGAFIGILILSVLSNGLILLNVSSFYHEIARGFVIILAVYLDGTRRRNLQKKMIRETR
jgi:ribose transport system permease protein